jgi:hypothetical protein
MFFIALAFYDFVIEIFFSTRIFCYHENHAYLCSEIQGELYKRQVSGSNPESFTRG